MVRARIVSQLRARLWPLVAPLTLFVLGFFGCLVVGNNVFEGVPHLEDEVAFLFQAKTIAGGSIVVPIPPHVDSFDLPFLIQNGGSWFGKYPPGHPAFLALGVLLGNPWLINPIAVGLSLALVYWLGRQIYGGRVGLLAGALGLVSPFVLLQGGTILSHPTTMLCLTIFLACFLQMMRRESLAWPAGVGLFLGVAFLSRQLTAIGAAVPFALLGLALLAGQPRRYLPRLAMVVVGVAPCVGLLLWFNASLTGNALTSPYELYWPYDKVGFGEGLGSAGNHDWNAAMINTSLNLDSLRTHLFGWPYGLDLVPLALAALGIVAAAGRVALQRGKSVASASLRCLGWDLLLLALAGSLVLVHTLYWASGIMYGPRYYFESLPALLLLSARGIAFVPVAGGWLGAASLRFAGYVFGPFWIAGAVAAAGRFRPSLWPRLVTAALVLGCVGYGLGVSLPARCAEYRGWYGITGEPVRRAGQLDLRNSLVFVSYGRSWTDYVALLSLNAPRLDSDTVFALDMGSGRNQAVAEHWPGRRVLYWSDLLERQ